MMKEQDQHYHARTRYKPTGLIDYPMLWEDLQETKKQHGLSLNIHLPFEIQHPHAYPNLYRGLVFIRFGEIAKRITGVPLYWENAPELIYGTWTLAHGQTDWTLVGRNLDLTLDVGHLMIGASSIDAAQERIRGVIIDRGTQIKHLHIHENDLVHDEHWTIGKVIAPDFLKEIVSCGATYIFEKGESIDGPTPRPKEWAIE